MSIEMRNHIGRETDTGNTQRLLMMVLVKNGGTKTFLKAGVSEHLLVMFSEMAQQGKIERVTETRQTITYRLKEYSLFQGGF